MTSSKNPTTARSYGERRKPKRVSGLITSPAKLTPDMMKVVIDRLEHGGTWSDAARAGGISPSTLTAWRKDVEQTADTPDLSKLPDHVRLWVADCEASAAGLRQRLAEKVAEAGGQDWRAAAWALERHDPEAWGPPTQRKELQVTGKIVHTLEDNTSAVLAFALDLVTNGLTLPDGRHLTPEDLLTRYTLPAPARAVYALRQMAESDGVVAEVARAHGLLPEAVVTSTDGSGDQPAPELHEPPAPLSQPLVPTPSGIRPPSQVIDVTPRATEREQP